ncbi:efflux RND transporter periplasmic adaptor subunit [Caldovatus aquaticus]|uniref:Efflux RND transporter periplasmic adaptor subunit n=1 Tax=Caldovatus aquaticus TaxID=2865671 RepID=A0ABS7F8A6_9PROT|nr:efflux RND transporter periplasmic adaptor subunit [Caldovatus aquaticus]MBW8271045.1 efflux RND transporter periplasmic adaptor subunit [Caldovatus aquaticus]
MGSPRLRLVVLAALLVAGGVAGWRHLEAQGWRLPAALGGQAAGAATAPQASPRPAPPPPVAVATEPVRRGPEPVEVLANGIVVPEAVVTVRTRVDGQIEAVHVEEGQMVRRGQPLFTLDSRLSRALLAQQEAQIARDRALLERARADQARYQSLRGEGFAAQQRLEQATAEAAAAAANVRAGEALAAQTRLGIEFATIVAEMDGRLGALPLRAGNFVRQAENTALATITRMDPILVQFSVPERWLPDLRAAMAAAANGTGPAPAVRVRADNDAGPPLEGELVFVDSAVDVQTGTIALKARFRNPELRLWPGQYVQVTLTPRIEPDAISVPAAALQAGQEGRFVFVLENGLARRRPVELVRTVGGRAVVRGALGGGERVIVEGAQRVADGMRAVDRGGRPGAPGDAGGRPTADGPAAPMPAPPHVSAAAH